ncbi:unnamed protein product [Ranitomeya imitator]|uniref:C2H2-type domain-containing protein n=1 Tax=Ranitomeya imitator TaxID=111125 RepID=A0ABN9LNF1_9NEOB|nr:unnamed protein product [Ranitomeya imitator]
MGVLQARSSIKHCQMKSEPLSSTGLEAMNSKRLEDGSEGDISSPASVGTQDPLLGLLDGRDDLEKEDGKHEPETVYETNCHWESCTKEFDTQEHLVHHINNEHIHGEKKEFVCHWQECSRELRPFKAQYMLVVHMRRHTGEKPHKCTFEGCNKAYSRLENLKTHLRSHTGEKPYVCEHEGCNKAFSNASDRAKHQNRTHSNETLASDARKRYKLHFSCVRFRQKTTHVSQNARVFLRAFARVFPCVARCVADAGRRNASKSQASPSGQSSCSSERSPLGSTNNNDSGVEMNANAGGSFEDLSNLDDIPSVESIGTAGASALRKLENLRIDKLNQMRKAPSAGKSLKLPAIHSTVSQGELPGICGLAHNGNIMELTSSEHLSKMNDRRNSTTSTISSAYTVSRRSSVVSPYLANQRPGDVGNMVDTYDQTAVDTSRHSNTNGLPGLTPAQQYRLKAKYAAATGGPPPTPLPNMERISANSRMAFAVGDYRSSSMSSASSSNIQRRHSNNEYHSYGTGIIHPSQAPGAGIRRASDPARPSGDPQVIPKVQRFKTTDATKQVSIANSNSCQQQGMYVNSERYNHLSQVHIKPEQQFHQSMPSMMSCQNMKQHTMHQHAFNQSNTVALSPGNSNCEYQGQQENQQNMCYNVGLNPNMLSPQGRRSQTPMMQVKEMMVRNYVQSQQALMWEQQPKNMAIVNSTGENGDVGQNQHRNTPHAPAYMSPKFMNYQNKEQQNILMSPNPLDNQPNHSKTMRSPGNQSYSVDMLPHPPCVPKPLSRQHSITSQSTYMGSPTQLSPSYHSAESSPRRMPTLPPIHCQSDSNDTTGMMYYSGQVEMHQGKTGNQKLVTAINQIQNSCDGHQHRQYSSNLGFVKPDTIPYSNSCPASNSLDSLDLENTQIDFAAIIDDTDHTPLISHNLTQTGLPGSSQSSSHLNTPRNPAAMVPNMAVSDLNSMLSSLAGENKFLNTIS